MKRIESFLLLPEACRADAPVNLGAFFRHVLENIGQAKRLLITY
jgi:hypothetical protein